MSGIDLGAILGAIKSTVDKNLDSTNLRVVTRQEIDVLLSGKSVEGIAFGGKAFSRKIKGRPVGMLLIKDLATDQEAWYGVIEDHNEVYTAKNMPALEFRLNQKVRELG